MPVKAPVRKRPKAVPVMVRNSEKTLFTKCRQAWQWAYVERWSPKNRGFGALVFGDMIHRALAAYYIPESKGRRKRGPHPAETYLKIHDVMAAKTRTGEFELRVDDEDDKWVNARELGEEMMVNYIDEFGPDKRYMIIYPEMPFQIALHDGNGKRVCIWVGTSDAFIRDMETGRYGLFEHKTAASINTNHLFLDEQANTYWALVPLWLRQNKILKEDQDLDFMLYNFMRKAKKDHRPQNELGQKLNKPAKSDLQDRCTELGLEYLKGWTMADLEAELQRAGEDPAQLGEVSKSQPPPLFHRQYVYRGDAARYNTYDRILATTHEMNLVRKGELEVYKAPGKDCAFCEFKDVCELHEQDSDWEELMQFTMTKWKPYEQHVWSLDL